MTVALLAFRGDASTHRFREVLDAFKRDGCNLLVTGGVDDGVRSVATRKLLGSPAADRSRVLVVGDDRPASRLLPGQVEPGDEAVRTLAYGDLDAAAVDAVADDIDGLRDAVVAAIRDLATSRHGFEAAELRLSVASLPALLDRYDTEDVAEFVYAVGDAVVTHDGMGHYHLPVADDAAVVSALTDHVDARVELRQDEAAAEQRWHVPGRGATQWVTL